MRDGSGSWSIVAVKGIPVGLAQRGHGAVRLRRVAASGVQHHAPMRGFEPAGNSTRLVPALLDYGHTALEVE